MNPLGLLKALHEMNDDLSEKLDRIIELLEILVEKEES